MSRALESKRGDAIAWALLDIFTTVGPPALLQADNGREFANAAAGSKSVDLSDETIEEVITEISKVWPSVKIVHGRARHSESNGGIERLNRTCQMHLGSWLAENNSNKWSVGRLFTRWEINTRYTRAVGDVTQMSHPPLCEHGCARTACW